MIGQISWESLGRFRVIEEEKNLHSLCVLKVSLEEKGKLLPYRLRKANELFLSKNIRTVITPLGFDHWNYFPHSRPYNPLATLQSLGGELALFHLKKRNIPLSSATVTLVSTSVTKQVQQVAFTLAKEVGEVILATGKGTQPLQESLFHTFGLAPCDYRNRSDVLLYFEESGEKKFGKSSLELHLEQSNSPDFLPIIQNKIIFLPQMPYLTQIALLLETGRISKKEIEFT